MIPLAVVVRYELRYRSSEMAFPDRNDPVETFFLHRSHEPLRVRIGVSCRLHRQRLVRYKPFVSRIPSIRCMAGRFS